ncbi:MAG: hypothetical protein CMN30_29420 [Sandaracinus sp.]|nr:hypothetical protein [Sandaracinus sp.]|tara:strand:+ start:3214 stop:3726 length:513 start_codon:yes stop_codon:yes gene_type:complete
MVSLLLLIGLTACSEDDGPKDLRLLTPQTTVHTLLDAYGVLEVPQAEIDRRMELGRRFHLNDPDARRLVFADWDEPADEGLAGYVFGNLVRTKDDLRITITEDVAHVRPGNPELRLRPVVLREDGPGWRIVLEESVPPAVATDLRRAFEERGRAGGSEGAPTALPRVPEL